MGLYDEDVVREGEERSEADDEEDGAAGGAVVLGSEVPDAAGEDAGVIGCDGTLLLEVVCAADGEDAEDKGRLAAGAVLVIVVVAGISDAVVGIAVAVFEVPLEAPTLVASGFGVVIAVWGILHAPLTFVRVAVKPLYGTNVVFPVQVSMKATISLRSAYASGFAAEY